MKNFRTLDAAIAFYQVAKLQKFRRPLQDQYDRALLSVVLNLSEGNAKPTARDRRKFFYTALASFREVQTLLLISDRHSLHSKSDSLGAMLYCLCKKTCGD